MRVKMILPALTEAASPFWRPIKYSLFPPLGLATLVPNSIVVSRGCPHVCDFCYKEAFFEGGRSFYTQTVDAALAEIERLPGRHLYFLDDHLFGDRRFASALFDGARSSAHLRRTTISWPPCATWPMPQGGRSSSRSGMGSSGRGAPR
jgi:hypothetical protein